MNGEPWRVPGQMVLFASFFLRDRLVYTSSVDMGFLLLALSLSGLRTGIETLPVTQSSVVLWTFSHLATAFRFKAELLCRVYELILMGVVRISHVWGTSNSHLRNALIPQKSDDWGVLGNTPISQWQYCACYVSYWKCDLHAMKPRSTKVKSLMGQWKGYPHWFAKSNMGHPDERLHLFGCVHDFGMCSSTLTSIDHQLVWWTAAVKTGVTRTWRFKPVLPFLRLWVGWCTGLLALRFMDNSEPVPIFILYLCQLCVRSGWKISKIGNYSRGRLA